MSKILGILKGAVCLTALVSASIAFGAEKNLELIVGGTIGGAPSWLDKDGKPITQALLNFDGQVTSAPGDNRDSDPFTVRLANIVTGLNNVEITTPNNCTIGAQNVSPEHVFLMVNNVPKQTGEVVEFTNLADTTLALRFSGAGGYGDKAGAVSCEPGLMAYRY